MTADATETYFLTLLGHFLTGQAPPAPPADCDWRQLHDLARRHRLSPLLAAALPPGAPPAASGPLQTQSRQRRIRTMVMVADYAAIRQGFAQANIPLVPLKGVALAHTVYPSPSMRYFDDLDMLIPPEQGPDALTVLAGLGYQPHPNAPAPEWHHLPPYVHPRHGTMVELHLDLLRRTGPGWALPGIWERLTTAELDGQPSPVLAPADALMHAILHGRHNLFHRLATFIDIGYLAEAVVEAGQVDLLVELATETGSLQLVGFALAELDSLFGWRPLAAQQRCFALTPRQRHRLSRLVGWHSLDLAQRPAHDGPLARLREARLADSWGQTGHYLRHLLFPPAEFVQQTYGANGESKSAGYSRRLLQRARVALRQFVSDRANTARDRR
jgi:hypothetical protein